MDNLREIVLDSGRLGGACACGIATVETLAGGPETFATIAAAGRATEADPPSWTVEADACGLKTSAPAEIGGAPRAAMSRAAAEAASEESIISTGVWA